MKYTIYKLSPNGSAFTDENTDTWACLVTETNGDVHEIPFLYRDQVQLLKIAMARAEANKWR